MALGYCCKSKLVRPSNNINSVLMCWSMCERVMCRTFIAGERPEKLQL